MISISVDGRYLDVPSQTIAVDRFSPISWLSKQGSKSYQIKLPTTRNNREILGFAEKIKARQKNFGIRNAVVNYMGIQIFYGKLRILNVTQNSYVVFLGLEKGALIKENDTLIRDLNWPKIQLSGNFQADFIAKGTDLNYPVFACFPVANSNIVASQQVGRYQNNFLIDSNEQFAPSNLHGTFNATPFFKIAWLLELIIEELGYEIGYNWFARHPELKNLTIYNNRVLSPIPSQIDPKMHLPEMKVSEFLSSIENFWNVSITPDLANKTASITSNAEAVKRPSLIITAPISPEYEMEFLEINDTDSGLLLKPKFSDGFQKEGKWNSTLEIPIPQSQNSAHVPGQMRYKWPLPPFLYEAYFYGSQAEPTFEIKRKPRFSQTTFWENWLDDNGDFITTLGEFTFGGGAESFESNACWPMMGYDKFINRWVEDNHSNGGYYDLFKFGTMQRVPRVEMVLNTTGGQNDFYDYGLIFMIYRGLMTHYDGTGFAKASHKVPTGTTDLWDHYQVLVPGLEISCKFNNDVQLNNSGVVAKFWSPTLPAVEEGQVTVKRRALLSAAEFVKLDLARTYIIDQSRYLIISAKADFSSRKGLSATDLELRKL